MDTDKMKGTYNLQEIYPFNKISNFKFEKSRCSRGFFLLSRIRLGYVNLEMKITAFAISIVIMYTNKILLHFMGMKVCFANSYP